MSLEHEFLTLQLKDVKSKNRLSIFDSNIEDSINKVIDAAKDSIPIKDAYANSLTSTGLDDKVQSFSSYGLNNNTLNWALWLALYNDSWVFRRAIDKPAQDSVNAGFTLLGDEDYSEVYHMFDKYKFDIIKLLSWGALFGGSVGVMLFDTITDMNDLKKPLDVSKIKGARMKIYVTDRWYGVSCNNTDVVTNMKNIDYGKPRKYTITFADGKNYEVHHSYVLRYEHRTAPNLIKNGQLQGWGYAEGSHILNELSRDDQLKSAITSLVNKSLIEVIKMSGMRGVFMGADKGNEEQLRKRLEMVNWGRNFNSLTFLDKDDDYTQNTFSGLTGLSDLLEKNMWLISAALEMQGILYGDLRGGLSQSNDDFERYAVTIKNRCDSYYRPVLQKLLMIIYNILGIEGQVNFDFNSLAKDKINTDKMESISKLTDLLSTMIDKGMLSKYEAVKIIENYTRTNSVNISFSEENINRLKLEQESELLQFNKTLNKNISKSAEGILESQFGERRPNMFETSDDTLKELPEKLDYIKEEVDESQNFDKPYNPINRPRIIKGEEIESLEPLDLSKGETDNE